MTKATPSVSTVSVSQPSCLRRSSSNPISLFKKHADVAAGGRAATRKGADGKVEQRRDEADDARHDHLLRQEAAKSNVAE